MAHQSDKLKAFVTRYDPEPEVPVEEPQPVEETQEEAE